MLLKLGCEIDAKDFENKKAVDLAREKGYIEIVNLFAHNSSNALKRKIVQ